MTVETKVEGSSTTASTYAYDHTQQTGKSVVTDSREAVAACSPERQFGVRFPREAKSRRDDRMGAILAAEKKRNTKIAKSTKVNVLYFRERYHGLSPVAIICRPAGTIAAPVKKVVYTIHYDQISHNIFTHNGTNWDSSETHLQLDP